ncbi:MAG: hypothetical protein R3B54_03260 [Bdellovibrionota bacterium]
MHTPRLCIDGRAAAEFETQGLVAQELIDQLVAAQGHPHAGSEWVEKRRTVLLSHPSQVFSGQLKRFDTKRRIGSSFFYSAWEKHFVESSSITAFHRFRPADRMEPFLECPTITTVLPAYRSLGATLPTAPESHRFVVPSQRDATLLNEECRIPEEQIRVIRPSARRYVHFADESPTSYEGQILFLTDGGGELDLRKLQHVVSGQYPQLPLRTFKFSEAREFSAKQWMKTLQFTSLCFYLTERAFDWPFLALESLYFNVPVIFMDKHSALSELLPLSPLRLSQYLTDFTTSSQLREAVENARTHLSDQGVLQQHHQALNYTQLYAEIPGAPTFAEV